MKKLITGLAAAGLALTAIAATPAIAQHSATGNSNMRAYDAYASAPESNYGMTADENMWRRPNSVYMNGEYRGTDPDTTIRQELQNSVPISEY